MTKTEPGGGAGLAGRAWPPPEVPVSDFLAGRGLEPSPEVLIAFGDYLLYVADTLEYYGFYEAASLLRRLIPRLGS